MASQIKSHQLPKKRHTRAFVRQFLRNPVKTGAIMPSSSFLTESMLLNINPELVSCYVEYGPGSGSFTHQAHQVFTKMKRTVLFEINPFFIGLMSQQYPHAEVCQGPGELKQPLDRQVDLVVSWHLIEDVFGWIAVLIGTLGMMIFKIPQIDPVISLGFAAFMIWNVARQLIKTTRLFLQATPDNINMETIRKDILSIEGVEKIHDVHLWSLDGASHVLTAHIVVAQGTTPQSCIDIKRQVRAHLDKGGSIHATIEIEWADEPCSLVSPQCHLEDHGTSKTL